MKKEFLLIMLFFYNFNLVNSTTNNTIKIGNIFVGVSFGILQSLLMYNLNKLEADVKDENQLLQKPEKNIFIKSCEDCKNKIIYGGFAMEINQEIFEEIIKNIDYFSKDNLDKTIKIFGESFKGVYKAFDAYKGTYSIYRKISNISKDIFGLAVLVGIIRGWLVKGIDGFIKEKTKGSKVLGTICSASSMFAQNIILDSIINALSFGIALRLRKDIVKEERTSVANKDVKDVQEIVKTVGAYYNILTVINNIKNIIN
jgi:hypothetical protein